MPLKLKEGSSIISSPSPGLQKVWVLGPSSGACGRRQKIANVRAGGVPETECECRVSSQLFWARGWALDLGLV